MLLLLLVLGGSTEAAKAAVLVTDGTSGGATPPDPCPGEKLPLGGKPSLCLGIDVAECPFQALNLGSGAAKLMAQLLFQSTHQLAAGLKELLI